MFVVHQDGDYCINLERVSYMINWDDKTKDALEDIHNRMYVKRYNYGSTENCKRAIEREQNHYISRNQSKKVLRIYVNGMKFAIYEDIKFGVAVYNSIINGLKHSENVIDLSQITQ